jgi:hypothetical protein
MASLFHEEYTLTANCALSKSLCWNTSRLSTADYKASRASERVFVVVSTPSKFLTSSSVRPSKAWLLVGSFRSLKTRGQKGDHLSIEKGKRNRKLGDQKST